MNRRDDTGSRLRSWHGGDRTALDDLIADNLAWIAAEVRRRLRSGVRQEVETQDLVQEAMVDVLEYGPRFEVGDRSHFRALVARIVENNIRDKHRYLHRDCRDVRRRGGRASDTVLKLDPAVRSVTSPSQGAHRSEREAWLRLALELLEPEDRAAIRLRDWEGEEFGAIGEQLGISAEAARKRYHRALPRLAQKVQQLRRGRLDGLLAGDGVPAARE